MTLAFENRLFYILEKAGMAMNFLIVDFEFTMYRKRVGRPNGFFPEIIEIGAVKYDADGNELARYQNFVKPHFYPKQAKEGMQFCMITEKDMKTAIEFPEMLNGLADMYEAGNTLFVTWGDEDYKVLDQGCNRHKLENPIKITDGLDLALAYRLYKGDDYTTGLKKATEELEAGGDGLWHTAFDDAVNTGRVLFKLMEKGWKLEDFRKAEAEFRAEIEERKAARKNKMI